ncbi:MAG: hypothetical protein KQI62_04505 [Deltaproteobacteria bacterium]|nr:hypothetical protein [Deltaproteobacteria bacterium]
MQIKRNFACPNYDSCLSEAIAQKVSDFHCQGCSYQDEVRNDWPEIQERDSRRVLSLFAAVCRNRMRPRSEPLTEDELAFLWEDAEGSDQLNAAGKME